MVNRWYRRRPPVKCLRILSFLLLLHLLVYTVAYLLLNHRLDTAKTWMYTETKLEEALKIDKGTGCKLPRFEPFSEEMKKFDKKPLSIVCKGQDWVKCYLSECRVLESILKTFKSVHCSYMDILYKNDYEYFIGAPAMVHGGDVYTLKKSDHVKIKCFGVGNSTSKIWRGHATGFRKEVKKLETLPGRENSIDVLIFGFDSTSRNGFIRRMPKSWEYLNKELEATVLNGYNILGDGTPATLFPILTGKTELELPDVRKSSWNEGSLDDMPFIFYKLRDDGYRTAYFEDMPWIGTFQYRFKGFKRQPADHYLRAFYLEEHKYNTQKYCIGDTLQYKLMMDITEQFLELEGKHFAFTFIADITHDDFNNIAIADTDTRYFLKALMDSGKLERTLLIMMGDHGCRFGPIRNTLQGKYEERMPLMAIRLPEVLKDYRPELAAILKNNSHVLTTPHDIYATILDAIDLQKYWNGYKIKGADLTRGLTLFEPIPSNRSCSEAGVEAHWCSCVAWDRVALTDPVATKVAVAFVEYINQLTEPVRSLCAPRVLSSVEWVSQQRYNPWLLRFSGNKDVDGYQGKFTSNMKIDKEHYQIKVEVSPGSGMFEASAMYLRDEDQFIFITSEISRTNAVMHYTPIKAGKITNACVLHNLVNDARISVDEEEITTRHFIIPLKVYGGKLMEEGKLLSTDCGGVIQHK